MMTPNPVTPGIRAEKGKKSKTAVTVHISLYAQNEAHEGRKTLT